MKNRLMLVAILALGTLVGAIGWGAHAQNASRVRWEYKVISSYGPSLTNPTPNVHQLNDAGAEGWELLTIRSGEYPKPGSNIFKTDYFLKRAK